jgi:hypothetical protein
MQRIALHGKETMTAGSVAEAASHGNRAAARTATSSTAVRLGRLGFVARGAVYVIVGWLALRAAVAGEGTATDKQGALEAIAQQPMGVILLVAVTLGLFAYAAWSLVRAVFDPERRGHEPGGLVARGGNAVAMLSYGGLALAAANLVTGSGSAGRGSDASTQDWTAHVLSAPLGPVLVIAIGVAFFAVATTEFIKAYTGSFRKYLSLGGLGSELRMWIVRVGRMGLVARGVVFALIGLFLIQASRHQDAGEAVGLGGALQKLAEQPYGQVLLGVVAAGLVMYGLFSFVEARYRRLRQ